MATQTQPRDAMQFVNEQDAATLERFIERLELRGKDPTFVAYREAYLKLIDLPRTAAVLEIGCGTGVVTRAIAARDGFAGTVTGVDQSPHFIAVAESLAADDGVATACSSPSATRTRSTSPTPASTPPSPTPSSATSATRSPCSPRPRASCARAGPSPSSTATTRRSPSPAPTRGSARRWSRAVQSIIMSSPRVMRELPRLLPRAGLRLIATQAHVYAEAGSSTFMLNLAETYAPLVATTGQLPAADVEAWLADQRRSAADGTFFAACNYYAYVARR